MWAVLLAFLPLTITATWLVTLSTLSRHWGHSARLFQVRSVNSCELTGPSVAMDTACSSSAVAIDAACKVILHGDYKSAIASGVSVFSSPFFSRTSRLLRFSVPQGRASLFMQALTGTVVERALAWSF